MGNSKTKRQTESTPTQMATDNTWGRLRNRPPHEQGPSLLNITNSLQVLDILIYHATKLQMCLHLQLQKKNWEKQHKNLFLCRKRKKRSLHLSRDQLVGVTIHLFPPPLIQAHGEPGHRARILLPPMSPCPAGGRMDGRWAEQASVDSQPPQAEFSLHTTSPIISHVPALACSDTASLSANSPFLLKQHNVSISLTIH